MNTPTDFVKQVQEALREARIPAWLFYGFHQLDPIAIRILGFGPDYHATRRWFYLIPAQGEPRKLVHRIESAQLDRLPGGKLVYLSWQQLRDRLRELLVGVGRAAMQYSPQNAIPHVSCVDAGTVELVQACGCSVSSSGDLVQRFEAVWSAEQVAQHRSAAQALTTIAQEAFEEAGWRIRTQGQTSEYSIQRFILDRCEAHDLITDSPPIVAANAHSGNPHYQPARDNYSAIHPGDFLLIDLWAKAKGSVFADITWVGYFGARAPDLHAGVFDVVRQARDRGVEFLAQRAQEHNLPRGFEVDDAVRDVIVRAGYGDAFVHRTGHSLGYEVHGIGVNFDNLETHDVRRVIPGIACTIEPGVYLSDFGVRSEINVYFGPDGPEVTTPPQQSIFCVDV
jgi:Xaa-Pro aminopeptidase